MSEACVTLMAKNMQQKAQTDYAIAFSGVAGPITEGHSRNGLDGFGDSKWGTDLLQTEVPPWLNERPSRRDVWVKSRLPWRLAEEQA